MVALVDAHRSKRKAQAEIAIGGMPEESLPAAMFEWMRKDGTITSEHFALLKQEAKIKAAICDLLAQQFADKAHPPRGNEA